MEQPEYAALCYQYIKALRGHMFDTELVSALFQEWERHKVDLYDAYLFSQIWTGLYNGEILWATIEIGHRPFGDHEREKNNTILQSLATRRWVMRSSSYQQVSAKGGFSAYFRGGNDLGDGYFEWHEPLRVAIISPLIGEIEMDVPPTRAPLEVGYTSISTTMYHLNLERCLARWPYESEQLHVFYCTDKWTGLAW